MADMANLLTRRTASGQLQQREDPSSQEWSDAIYHDDAREELLRQANLAGVYGMN